MANSTKVVQSVLDRAIEKSMRMAYAYSMGHTKMVDAIKSHNVVANLIIEYGDVANIQSKLIKERWETYLKQQYIIEGEWSQYHHMVSATKGWGLSQKGGMWQIVSVDTTKFPTDEDARLHVLQVETIPGDIEHELAKIATNAIMVGNVRG